MSDLGYERGGLLSHDYKVTPTSERVRRMRGLISPQKEQIKAEREATKRIADAIVMAVMEDVAVIPAERIEGVLNEAAEIAAEVMASVVLTIEGESGQENV